MTINSETINNIVTESEHNSFIPQSDPVDKDIAISVCNVSKMYPLYADPRDRLKQSMWYALPKFLRGQPREFYREFWALHDVSIEVKKGKSLGIIGHNGAGKSTLLQIIAGTLTPSHGEVRINGRVAALLELGSGFNPDFTGRENVYLNGSILGFSREEMDSLFDEIAAFADIGEFMDQPVKLYSSGMFVRLAFAVQACVEPDILVVDEALAVGDVFFRQKCYQRLEKLRDWGTAIILVSHSMMEVEQFCQHALLLHRGEAHFHGAAPETVKRYFLITQTNHVENPSTLPPTPSPSPGERLDVKPIPKRSSFSFWPAQEAFFDLSGIDQVSNHWARCTGAALCNSQGDPTFVFEQGGPASFFYEFELLRDIEVPISGVLIRNDKGITVHGKSTVEYGSDVPHQVARGTRLRFRQDISLEIAVGEYTFEIALATINRQDYQRRGDYTFADLSAKYVWLCALPGVGHFTIVFPRNGRPVRLLHHGVANLPGACRASVIPPT